MTEKVLISKRGTVFSVGAVSSIIGASMFITNIKGKAENNFNAIKENKVKIEKVDDEQKASSKILSKIEGKLDILIQRVSK